MSGWGERLGVAAVATVAVAAWWGDCTGGAVYDGNAVPHSGRASARVEWCGAAERADLAAMSEAVGRLDPGDVEESAAIAFTFAAEEGMSADLIPDALFVAVAQLCGWSS